MSEDAATAPEAGRSQRRAGGLLWHRNFRLLWVGETVSQLGNAMAVVGVPLLAVLDLHASTFEVGALVAAGWLPWLIIGLPAGAWVDRLPARTVMIVCDLASASLYASVPIAAALGWLTYGQVLAVELAAGAANVMFATAYEVNLPSLVTADKLVEGNAKLQGSFAVSRIGGGGLAGLAAEVMGAATALAVNTASFLVSAGCLLAISARAPARRAGRAATGPLRHDVADGVAFVAHDPYLRPLALYGGVANLALDAYAALVVVFLVRDVGLGAGLVGAMMAVPGIAGLTGAVVARRVAARLGSGRALLASALGMVPFALLIPLTGPGPRLAFFAAGTLAAATGITMCNIIVSSFRQAYCPPGTLGRVTATMRVVTYGTSPVGALAGGAIGTLLGPRDALWVVMSVLALAGTVMLTGAVASSPVLPAGPPATGPPATGPPATGPPATGPPATGPPATGPAGVTTAGPAG